MKSFIQRIPREALYQTMLIGILFLADAYDQHKPGIFLNKLSFFTSYTLAALFIGYVLLPRFFYKRHYISFALGILAVLAAVIVAEELILERIFYPNSRGTSFPGVIHTLIEVLPIILILVGFKFAWDAQKKQTQLEQLQTMVAESRLQFLKSQINPHFLFNNLNNLYAYALENSPKTPTIILELSSLLRYMLYDCQENLVPLQKEIKCLNDFIRLQTLQIEDRGQINFKVDGKTENLHIAPLILIVFIENCFKHSLSSQIDDIDIQVTIAIREDKLHMECINTFSPNSNTQELSKGIGLENVRSRLELLYPAAHTLAIKSENQLFTVQLELLLTN